MKMLPIALALISSGLAHSSLITTEKAREIFEKQFVVCTSSGQNSTISSRHHEASVDLELETIQLIGAGITTTYVLKLIDYVPQPNGKAYVRFGGSNGHEAITVGALKLNPKGSLFKTKGGIVTTSHSGSISMQLNSPANCKTKN
ncbi:MAG: hypothetical protein ACOYL6_15355 [Bacteriovoracaceae bacterium]